MEELDGGKMEGYAEVNGAKLWYQITGDGEPVIQLRGTGFGHFNLAPVSLRS